MSERLLLVQTPGKLDLYEVRDSARTRSILPEEDLFSLQPPQISAKIELKWVKSHPVSFRSRFMGVGASHFILGGRDFVAAFDLEGNCATSWRFKDA